jgi:hypothetical protein
MRPVPPEAPVDYRSRATPVAARSERPLAVRHCSQCRRVPHSLPDRSTRTKPVKFEQSWGLGSQLRTSARCAMPSPQQPGAIQDLQTSLLDWYQQLRSILLEKPESANLAECMERGLFARVHLHFSADQRQFPPTSTRLAACGPLQRRSVPIVSVAPHVYEKRPHPRRSLPRGSKCTRSARRQAM